MLSGGGAAPRDALSRTAYARGLLQSPQWTVLSYRLCLVN